MGMLADDIQLLEDLRDRKYTPKELAQREGLSVSMVYKIRRKYELQTGKMLPRFDGRGRKPQTNAAA